MDFQKLNELVNQRDEFLAQHPELQPLQNEINKALLKAGSDKAKRNQVLQEMMLSTWYKIVELV